ncbi:hypothetical protein L6307_03235 [Candidatus Parcubacteria bacterium]|nr:hypothetical protein [Candidatus Parcubacteria bacterium]
MDFLKHYDYFYYGALDYWIGVYVVSDVGFLMSDFGWVVEMEKQSI